MKIAGRCECGMVWDWVIRKPDEHLACFGLRWCGVCGEAAVFRGDCPACRRISHNKYMRKRIATDPAFKARHRKHSREWAAAQRRGDGPAYQREKERKRLRY